MYHLNHAEVCVAALERSGHHAIINWISANSAAPVCFINNCRLGVDPYLMCTEDQRVKPAPGSLLIYNYEDRRLGDAFPSDFLNRKTKWFGARGIAIYFLILRDPFNNFASKYRWAINGTKWTPPMEWLTDVMPGLWKSYAREFLGLTDLMPTPKVCINYNRWFADKDYRDRLAWQLGLASSGKGLTEVAKWGPNTWGDSFDNLEFEGRANEMKVLERWRHFADDRDFQKLFHDRELHELSERIFGVIPGTESFSQESGRGDDSAPTGNAERDLIRS
jgi:hypothetical protein